MVSGCTFDPPPKGEKVFIASLCAMLVIPLAVAARSPENKSVPEENSQARPAQFISISTGLTVHACLKQSMKAARDDYALLPKPGEACKAVP